MLENAGFVDDAGLEPRQCPRCKALNAYDIFYCATCLMAPVEEAAGQMDEATEEAKQSADYLQLLLQIKKDLGLS